MSGPRTGRCHWPRPSAGSCRMPTVTAVAGTGVVPAEPADIPAAVTAAEKADVVILYVGGRAGWFGSEFTEGEGTDTANIDLPAQQVELIERGDRRRQADGRRRGDGPPAGPGRRHRPLPAVLTAYYGGPHQGEALADALFGVTNPGGKLPVTLPRHVGQVPIHHGQKTGSGYRRTEADIHKGYLDLPSTPLFPFGHGLSYTTFEYGPLELESDRVDVGGELRASLTVTNTGSRTWARGRAALRRRHGHRGDAARAAAHRLRPRRPGTWASETVSFVVPISLLAYTGISDEVVMEPGPVEVSAGSSSDDIRSSAEIHRHGQDARHPRARTARSSPTPRSAHRSDLLPRAAPLFGS